MDAENLDLILNTNGDYNMHSFASNEEMSSDLQKRLKRINKLTDGLYETKFKIDRYKFDRALKNELADKNVLETLFHDIQAETNTHIVLWMKSKSNSKLRNPLVNVVGTLDGIERAKERVLSIFENIKTRVVLKMDVSYKDHSHIIGRGGFSIQRVMDDTGSHCHFPDSNRISEIKKSNVVLVCGSPCGVEQARCKIRSLLPLVVHFKIPIEHVKRSAFEQHSKHIRAIQQALNVHVSLRSSSEIDESHAAIFDSTQSSNYIAVSVRGQNNELAKLQQSLALIINRFTDNSGFEIVYTLTIEITEFYHQLVMGTNHANIRNIQQQTECSIDFPVPVEANLRHLDFDNLNEIPVNKSTVIIKGPSFEAVHVAWKELIGCLPLVLTFDVPHDQQIDTALISQLKKHYKVAIFLKHKEKYNTVIIRGIEKNSRALFEVRKQLLKLDDEIPICCNHHGAAHLGGSKIFGHLDENGNSLHESSLNSFLGAYNGQPNGLGLLNGNAANLLNAKLMQNIDTNNNPLNEKGFSGSFVPNANGQSEHTIPPNLFRAALHEQNMLLQKQQQQMISRKQSPFQPAINQYGNGPSNPLHMLANVNMNDEANKLMRQQVGLGLGQVDHPSWRFTQSVSDISHLQTASQMFPNQDAHQAIKKEHLTSSCSSPALNHMIMQNSSNSSMLNNFSLNNSNLNSTGSHNTSTTSNAAASTANNSFSSPRLNASPPAAGNSSFNSSLINNANNSTQSPIASTTSNGMNWPERRQNTYYDSRYLALKNTYEKQDTNEVRVPSSAWAGLGFSKSMSQDTKSKLNEWNPIVSPPNQSNFKSANSDAALSLDDLKKHSSKALATIPDASADLPWPNLSEYGQPAKQRALIKQESEICSSSHPYSSSYLNNLIGGDHAHFGSKVMQSPIGRNTAPFHTANGDHLDTPASFEIDKIDLDTVLREFGHAKFIDTFQQYKINFARFLTLTEDDLAKLSIDYHNRRKLYQVILQFRRFLVPNYYEKAIGAAPKQPDDLTINKTLKPFSNYTPSIGSTDQQSSSSSELLLFDGTSSALNNALNGAETKTAAVAATPTSPESKVDTDRDATDATICNAFESMKLDGNEATSEDGFEIVCSNDAQTDGDKKCPPVFTSTGSNDESANCPSADGLNDATTDQLTVSEQPAASELLEHSVPEVAQA